MNFAATFNLVAAFDFVAGFNAVKAVLWGTMAEATFAVGGRICGLKPVLRVSLGMAFV